MPRLTRRSFALAGSSLLVATPLLANSQPPKSDETPQPPSGPVEAPFERDYEPPKFKPSWKNQQLNRTLVQDFIIFAHSEIDMVKKLLAREPNLVNGAIDWGNGDWETAIGGASHMGRHDIVELLLANNARCDLFCAAMLGHLEVVKTYLTMQPSLIDAKGPHGFSLHFHAQVGAERSAPVLEYLQSIKTIELKPIPFLNSKKPNS